MGFRKLFTSLFIHYKIFRLDYHGLNCTGGKPAWHYNVTSGFAQIKGMLRGTKAQTDHAVTLGSRTTGKIITIFRWGGRAMFLVGGIMSACEFYYAENKSREITRQAGGWSGGIALAKYGAAGGAKLGAAIAVTAGQAGPQVAAPEELVTVPADIVLGTIIGGVGGGIVGWVAVTNVTEVVFDWVFTPLQKEEWLIYDPS